MAKSETGDLVFGVVIHGDTPEERQRYARELASRIMKLSEDDGLMVQHKGVQIKRSTYTQHQPDENQPDNADTEEVEYGWPV